MMSTPETGDANVRTPALSVVVVTYCRPDFVERCLLALERQDQELEVVVVDASPDNQTAEVVARHPSIRYLRNPNGIGHMTQSRNIGTAATRAPFVSFIDDDAFVHDGWARALVQPYKDEAVGAVGGRALNGQPGEECEGVDQIGRLLPSGELTGNFAADPGRCVDVDHLIGCNMSFRRSVLEELSGFRECFPGTALREDTDMCLRVRAKGHRLVFEPAAAVDHVGAPHARGARFDFRYQYFAHRNHVAMLIWNFGASAIVRRYLAASGRRSARSVGVSVAKLCLWVTSTAAGIVAGLVKR